MASFDPIVGRYLNLEVDGRGYRVYVEEAGAGIPLLCLHTAGADSRQFRHLLNDAAVTSRYRVIAFDMPYHGRTNPPDGWWLEKYKLTTAAYLGVRARRLDRAWSSSARSSSAARWAAPSC